MTYRDRRAAKADRLREWADKRDAKAAALQKQNERYRGDTAFNTQPGHIPERARVIRRSEQAYEHTSKAKAMRSRAAGIDSAADRAIYSDDPDALEQLREKLDGLESTRERYKAENKAYRKEHRAELKAMTAGMRSLEDTVRILEMTALEAAIQALCVWP